MPPKSIVPHRHAVDDVLDVEDYYRGHQILVDFASGHH